MKFIPIATPTLGIEEEQAVIDCVRSTWISSRGTYIEKFEKLFADYFRIKYAISCSNGTAALHLALLALNIGAGDEVIVPVLTFVASVNVIKYVGATPIFIDCDEATWNVDTSKIESKISKHTRAIIAVHLYGFPANMEAIMKIAKKHNLSVIEDAAEAHAAKYQEKYVGTIGDIGCFSFYGNKIITTGEGGMAITSNRKLAEKMRLLKNHGMSTRKKYYHPIIGFNYRMTNIQAAIGFTQLTRINHFLIRRLHIEKLYRGLLETIPGLTLQPKRKKILSVCWLFPLLITKQFGLSAKKVQMKLAEKFIETRPFFYPVTRFPMYKTKESFPVAQKISRMGINLPSSPNLTDRDIQYIAKTLSSLV